MNNNPGVLIDFRRCDFCGTCVGVCPSDAIELLESFIVVHKEQCTMCLDCITICPLGIPEVIE